jgi:hypothetical protein
MDSSAKALADVRGYASAGRIVVTFHAERRMGERGATHPDVRHALVKATGCTRAQRQGCWEVHGPDLDGDDLKLIVAIEDGVIVVTLY